MVSHGLEFCARYGDASLRAISSRRLARENSSLETVLHGLRQPARHRFPNAVTVKDGIACCQMSLRPSPGCFSLRPAGDRNRHDPQGRTPEGRHLRRGEHDRPSQETQNSEADGRLALPDPLSHPADPLVRDENRGAEGHVHQSDDRRLHHDPVLHGLQGTKVPGARACRPRTPPCHRRGVDARPTSSRRSERRRRSSSSRGSPSEPNRAFPSGRSRCW